MRGMLAIARLEARMHLRSKRLWLLLGLAAFFNFNQYTAVLYSNELQGTLIYFPVQLNFLYIALAALVALISTHRLRSTGAHTLLFTRPVSSFSLLAGQVLGGYVFLLPVLLWWILPLGLLMRGLFEMDFPLAPLAWVAIFWWTPMTLGVMALAIWMKTWFRNSIVAIITIGMGIGVLFGIANSPLLNPKSESLYGYEQIHTPMPFVSCFSTHVMQKNMGLSDSGYVSFVEPESWKLLALGLLFPVLFLHLATYRIRRTEPQRKVFKRYGRRWFHAPTYVRAFFDLFRFDPRVGFRMHAITLALIVGIVAGRSSGAGGDRQAMMTGAMMQAEQMAAMQKYGADKWMDRGMVDPEVISARETMTPTQWDATLTMSIDEPTSGRLLSFYAGRRDYSLQSIELGGKPVVNRDPNGQYFVEGAELNEFVGAGPIELKMRGVRDAALAALDIDRPVWEYSGRSLIVLNAIVAANTEFQGQPARFLTTGTVSWPAELTIEIASKFQIFESPVVSDAIEQEPLNRFVFEIPEALNRMNRPVRFYNPDAMALIRLSEFTDSPPLGLRILVPVRLAPTMRELMELAPPMLEEFARLQQMNDRESISLIYYPTPPDAGSHHGDQLLGQLKQLRTYSNIYRLTGKLPGPIRDQYVGAIRQIEQKLLSDIQNDWYSLRSADAGTNIGGGLGAATGNRWDLDSFLSLNMENGLNARIAGGRFIAAEYRPSRNRIGNSNLQHLESQASRADLMRQQTIPVFQMLYLWMGHDAWRAMLPELRHRMKNEGLTVDIVQDIAQRQSPVPLEDFFDYWLRTGKGFPKFHVREAWFDRIQLEGDDAERFAVHAVIEHTAPIRMPVPLRLDVTGGRPLEATIWAEPGEPIVWEIDARQPPWQLSVDPDGWLLSAPWLEGDARVEKPWNKRLEERSRGGAQ